MIFQIYLIINNKINYLRNEKKSVKLKLQNSNHLIKSFELEKRDNMQMNNNKNSNKKKSDKKNIFRFSLNKKIIIIYRQLVTK